MGILWILINCIKDSLKLAGTVDILSKKVTVTDIFGSYDFQSSANGQSL